MKKQRILVNWIVQGFVEVDGNTMQEAMRNFEQNKESYSHKDCCCVNVSSEPITNSP